MRWIRVEAASAVPACRQAVQALAERLQFPATRVGQLALTSILRNLLSNGIKYTDHGEVRLSAQVTGPRLEIRAADTGIGIPAGLHGHVLEEFYQVPGVRRGGTGLGLPYARRLAGILGGDLTLTSEPDAGTTVLLDVKLPDMIGYDVCRQIKDDPATAAIPVVQVSATAVQVSDRARGLTQGADAYLIDPNEPEELLAVVMAALRYSRARQRAERTASLLTALTSVALDINAAETFDGLARAAAAGAARIFAAQAVLVIEMPDGQIRRTSASPEQPEPRQRGAPRGLADLVTARILTESQASGAVMLSREEWLALVPDSTLRCDITVAAVRPRPDRPPVAMAVDRAGVPGDDGLVEERGVFIDVNLEKLRVAAQEASGADVEAFSNHLMSIFGPREDDVAMVAVRRI